MTSSALSRHLEMGKVCGLQCEKCTKTFSHRSTTLNHQKKCTMNETSKWHCELCATTFKAKVHLERHRKEGNYDAIALIYNLLTIDQRRSVILASVTLRNGSEDLEKKVYFNVKNAERFFQVKKHFWDHIDIKKKEFHCKLCDMK
jgi:hypothetical protein